MIKTSIKRYTNKPIMAKRPLQMARSTILNSDDVCRSKYPKCIYCDKIAFEKCTMCDIAICSYNHSTLWPKCLYCDDIYCYKCVPNIIAPNVDIGVTRCNKHWNYDLKRLEENLRVVIDYDTISNPFILNIQFHIKGYAEIYKCKDSFLDCSVIARNINWYEIINGYMHLINDSAAIMKLNTKRNKLICAWIGEVYAKMRYLLMTTSISLSQRVIVTVIIRLYARLDAKFILFSAAKI